jgi:predicted glutamine amidotransferase
MCELMGLSFARPVSADFSIREFASRDRENADGWGLAWYPDQSVALVKEPLPWSKSKYTGFLETYRGLSSSIYIAHVRRKTTGGVPSHADTHPFVRELGGREYCFAHNGTLAGLSAAHLLGRYRPIGGTDSEYVFCHLLAETAERETRLDGESDWRWLHEKLQALNRLGKLNCILSDGRRLFCYHDAAGYKGLSMRQVQLVDGESRSFGDSELKIELAGPEVNHGFAVATHPLSESGWVRFEPGELLVLEEGVAAFSSHREIA